MTVSIPSSLPSLSHHLSHLYPVISCLSLSRHFSCLYPVSSMKLSRSEFKSIISVDGPDISFSLYHECLHSIAFTHTKTLSLPRRMFIDPASPVNNDGSVSVRFLPHWRGQLLLPLFTRLLRLYIKLQLRLTDDDFQHILSSFDDLPVSDLDDVLSLSLKQLRRHLNFLRSTSFLDLLCNWKHGDPSLDFFLHIGGVPMIIVGDILIREDVQTMISQLLRHVGSPTSLMHCSHRS